MVASESGFEIRQKPPQWLYQSSLILCLILGVLGFASIIVLAGILPIIGIFVASWILPTILSTFTAIGIICGLACNVFIRKYVVCLSCQQPAICEPCNFSVNQYTCPHCGQQCSSSL